MTTLTFAILDSSVTKESQVFDHLVQVRRLDTQEEGLLLCSHCCKWPVELIPQATWLEGCFTPSRYEDDARLLMGYHPHQLTKWSINWEAREVTLSLVGGGTGMGDSLVFPIPHFRLESNTRLYRRVSAYLSRIPQEGTYETYLRSVFSFVVNLYQRTGDISLVLAAPAWIMNNNPYAHEGVNVHFTEGGWINEVRQVGPRKDGYNMDPEGNISGPTHYLPWVNDYGYDTYNAPLMGVFEDVGPWAKPERIPLSEDRFPQDSVFDYEDLCDYWELPE